MKFFFWFYYLYVVYCKNINIGAIFPIPPSIETIPLYASETLNSFYTFLFLGEPLQKVLVSISILGGSNILICPTNISNKPKNYLYDPLYSTSAINLQNFTSLKNNVLYPIRFQNDSDFFSGSYQESHISLGNGFIQWFSDSFTLDLQCLADELINYNDNLYAGIVDLTSILQIQTENNNVFSNYFGYAIFMNETKGFFRLLNKTFNYSKLDQGFSKIMEITLKKNENISTYFIPFEKMKMDEDEMLNFDGASIAFSTLTNFIELPKIQYENFLFLFRNFCQNNKSRCFGKQFINSPYCFLNEIDTSDDFFQSFPKISFKLNSTFELLITSEDYFQEISEGYFCIGIKSNDLIENIVILGNNYLRNKLIFFDGRTSIISLWTPPIKFDFGSIFAEEIGWSPRKNIPSINAIAIVLPTVFSITIIIFLVACYLKRKRKIDASNLLMTEKEVVMEETKQNSFETSYTNYERQKLKEKLSLNIEMKESFANVEEDNVIMSASKPLETLIVSVAENPVSNTEITPS